MAQMYVWGRAPQCDVANATISDEKLQAPMEGSEAIGITQGGDDPSEPKQLLSALIDAQHRQLMMNIEENRKALLDYIGALAWPCQQSPCGSVSGNIYENTCNAVETGQQPKSRAGFNSKL